VRDDPALSALGAADEIALRNLLLGLDEASRISRFCYLVDDNAIARHARHAVREAAFIAGVCIEGELCGAVEVYEACEPGEIEAVFAVTRRRRRQGIGTALLFTAIEWARRSHCTKLQMSFTRGNWPMRRLAAKAEPSLHLGLDKLTATVAVGGATSAAKLSRGRWKVAGASQAWRALMRSN
jgi:GNAT superfamily N-acetyltransferase